jgi:photosystem II stability/assembly factor-like uncharacterized protein
MRIPYSTLAAIALTLAGVVAQAQVASPTSAVWQVQDSGTTAGLRGIDSVDGKVAWASGTGGTVLKTVDGGAHWTKCVVPDADKDGATLDFRGVQAWDATTAIVMASGPGDKSRLYKTTDGCKTWTLVFTNPGKDGFWDAIHRDDNGIIWLLGDPVNAMFTLFTSKDDGENWYRWFNKGVQVHPGTQITFAASNSSLETFDGPIFGTGGTGGVSVFMLSVP